MTKLGIHAAWRTTPQMATLTTSAAGIGMLSSEACTRCLDTAAACRTLCTHAGKRTGSHRGAPHQQHQSHQDLQVPRVHDYRCLSTRERLLLLPGRLRQQVRFSSGLCLQEPSVQESAQSNICACDAFLLNVCFKGRAAAACTSTVMQAKYWGLHPLSISSPGP